MSAFYEGLADILEVDIGQISPELALDDGNWDSLAIVSTIALIDEVYDETVSADALGECKTVADVEKLIKSKMAG